MRKSCLMQNIQGPWQDNNVWHLQCFPRCKRLKALHIITLVIGNSKQSCTMCNLHLRSLESIPSHECKSSIDHTFQHRTFASYQVRYRYPFILLGGRECLAKITSEWVVWVRTLTLRLEHRFHTSSAVCETPCVQARIRNNGFRNTVYVFA